MSTERLMTMKLKVPVEVLTTQPFGREFPQLNKAAELLGAVRGEMVDNSPALNSMAILILWIAEKLVEPEFTERLDNGEVRLDEIEAQLGRWKRRFGEIEDQLLRWKRARRPRRKKV